MSSSSDWRQNDNWRVTAPPVDRGEEKPTSSLSPSPAQASGGWRNTEGTSETCQRGKRRPHGQHSQGVTQQGASESADTIAQGRRIYLGNLLYRVKPESIEEMLETEGFGEEVESIHISVDPVTGRNPGYCFIDFKTLDAAQRALMSLPGTPIQGRPVKVGPCQPKRAQATGRRDDYTPTFQRWGDWKGSRPSDPAEFHPGDGMKQGPYGALDHIDVVRNADAPARVYFGGLGKMINQEENDREVRSYLDGFNVYVPSS